MHEKSELYIIQGFRTAAHPAGLRSVLCSDIPCVSFPERKKHSETEKKKEFLANLGG